MGKPVPCNKCNGDRAAISHVQACVAVPIHELLRAGRPLDALEDADGLPRLGLPGSDESDRLARIGQDPVLLGRIGRLRQQTLQAQAQAESYDPP
jgi:hypothetical protein